MASSSLNVPSAASGVTQVLSQDEVCVGAAWPGPLRTQVFFVAAQTKGAVIAPVTALRASADGGTTVGVVDADGKESERTVQVGLRTRFRVEILKGLAPGERVVTGRKADSGKTPLVSFHL